MRKIIIFVTALLLTTSSFAQNIDWVNAPLNPIPERAHLKKQNLKGDVFQVDYRNFDKNGNWIPSNKGDTKEKVELDAMGRVIKEITYYGSVTNYTYDARGNLTKEYTPTYNKSYSYDNKNRLIKMVYLNNDRKTHNSLYRYKQLNELLIVHETRTDIENTKIELETHFKNGLKIYDKVKDGSGIKLQYQIDNKGNWITLTTIDEATNRLKFTPFKREIIYYDETGKGFSVVSRKIYENISAVAPKVLINNKLYHTASTRYNDDYVFYDKLSTTYYLAKDGYNKNNVEGQKFTVEKISSGYETVLLFNGKNDLIVEDGSLTESTKKWTLENFNGVILATDSSTKKSYAFGPLEIHTDNKIIAYGGKNMMEEANKVCYLVSGEKKSLFIFERGKNISNISTVAKNDELTTLLSVNGVPRIVIPSSKNRIQNAITPARYFDPAKDKLTSSKPQIDQLLNGI